MDFYGRQSLHQTLSMLVATFIGSYQRPSSCSCPLLPDAITIGRHPYAVSDCRTGITTHAYKLCYATDGVNLTLVLDSSFVFAKL